MDLLLSQLDFLEKILYLSAINFYNEIGLNLFQSALMSTYHTRGDTMMKKDKKNRLLPLRISQCIRRDGDAVIGHNCEKYDQGSEFKGIFIPGITELAGRNWVMGTGKMNKFFSGPGRNLECLGTKNNRYESENIQFCENTGLGVGIGGLGQEEVW